MAFRVRLDATPSKNVMIGVDGDQNGSLDFYYVFDNSKPIETFDAGTGANVSPSTSDLGKNPMQQITRVDGTNFAIATVTSIDSGFKHDF